MKKLLLSVRGHRMPILFFILISAFFSSSFVTPQAVAKRSDSPVGYSFDPSEHSATYYLRIKVNGVAVINTIDDVSGEINAPAGSTVTFEASVDPNWIMTILIDDNHPTDWGELYYSDNQTTMSFSWTAEEGHSYFISFNGH